MKNAKPGVSLVTRRTFLRSLASLPLILAATPACAARRRVRFGIVSDVHQDVIRDSVDRINAFVAAMRKANADFIIQLGDFCWPHPRNAPFLAAWNAFGAQRYHVLGNHDMDGGFTREQTVAYYGIPGRHYAFTSGPVRGLVLDSNDPGGKGAGYKRFIAPDQMKWLERELDQTDRPVLVFVHCPFDGSAKGIENSAAIRSILERAEKTRPATVAAVFSGHFHEDCESMVNGIRYIRINSASYCWLTEAAARETFAPELHRAHPYLKYVAAYREPLWALATLDLDSNELTVEGKRSEWVGPDPWQRGVTENEYPHDKCRPAISDRSFAIKRFS